MSRARLQKWLRQHRPQRYIVAYSVLALTVLLPLLKPGYVLTLDMVFTPELFAPRHVANDYLFWQMLHALNLVIPSQVIQKVLLFIILVLSGAGMHRLFRQITTGSKDAYEQAWTAYAAGALYMINPFTYSRFLAGQYVVLLGYALLPFFVRAILRFLEKPTRRNMAALSLWAVLISAISLHTLGLVLAISATGFVLGLWRYRHQSERIRKLGTLSIGAALLFVALSSYWLVPLAMGNGTTAETIDRFGPGDMQTFATVGDSTIEQLGNVIRLQGFWAEGRSLFALPQDQLPGWGLIALVIWLLVIRGCIALWQNGKRLEVSLLIAGAVIAVLLSIGGLANWLAVHVPFFSGYREPHKFIALVVLMYAVGVGQGSAWLAQKYQKRFGEIGKYSVITVVSLVIVLFTPTMFWGFGGQLQTSQYPADWFAVNRQLSQDTGEFQVLFLPWHLYMHFTFADRIIANPAEKFFGKPVLVSNDPEFGNASTTSRDTTKKILGTQILPKAPSNDTLGRKIAPLKIKYILLAKETDFEDYAYLDRQKDLKLIREYGTLKLYRNEAF